MSGCDVLAVFAHPDDESLLAGGLLAACSAAGLSVGVVSLTRGELGVVEQGPALARGAPADAYGERLHGRRAAQGAEAQHGLGELRERELQRAVGVLGAAWGRCLDFPDGELGSVERAAPVRSVRELLGEHAPAVVVTFSSEGLYWHPDHIATYEIVHEAAEVGSVCEVTWPEGLLLDTVEQMRARGLGSDVWGLDPEAFGVPVERIARELDVSRFLGEKLRALGSHRSQLPPGQALGELPEDLARRLLGREWLTASVKADWLAEVVERGSGSRP